MDKWTRGYFSEFQQNATEIKNFNIPQIIATMTLYKPRSKLHCTTKTRSLGRLHALLIIELLQFILNRLPELLSNIWCQKQVIARKIKKIWQECNKLVKDRVWIAWTISIQFFKNYYGNRTFAGLFFNSLE